MTGITPTGTFQPNLPITTYNRRVSIDLGAAMKIADPTQGLYGRAISQLNQFDKMLDARIPSMFIHRQTEGMVNYIEGLFVSLTPFNQWLDAKVSGNWYQMLANFLVKLPMRSARNVVQLLFSMIKGVVYGVTHPLKAVNHLLKLLLTLVSELSQPESWTSLGGSIMGGALGQCLISGNPLSVIGMGLGMALTIGGFSNSVLKGTFKSALLEFPEASLSGFLMGMLIGFVERTLYQKELVSYRTQSLAEAKSFAKEFTSGHSLPDCSAVSLDSGKIVLNWSNKLELATFKGLYPEVFRKNSFAVPTSIDLYLDPSASYMQIHFKFFNGIQVVKYSRDIPSASLHLSGRLYPNPPGHKVLCQYGSLAAPASLIKV